MMKGILDNFSMNFSLSIHECVMIPNIDAGGEERKYFVHGDNHDNYRITL